MRRAHRLTPVLGLFAVLFGLWATAFVPTAGAVEWKHWNEGLEESRLSGKPMLVDVYTDWCGWCKRMDAEVYARPDVSGYLASHFVTVRLNAESGEPAVYQGRNFSSRTLASAFNVNVYPTTIFFDTEGTHLANAPGYLSRERLMLLLHYIGDGHLARNESFDSYLKEAQGAHPAP